MEKKDEIILAKKLSRKTHFKTVEVEQLLALYNDYSESGVLTKRGFREFVQNIFKITDKLTLDRTFHVFDSAINGFVSREDFVSSMSVFLMGSMEEQTMYCFSVYDLSGDRLISREEMMTLMGDCLRTSGEEEENEGVKVKQTLYIYCQAQY